MPETKVASRHLNTKDFIARAKEADESVTSSTTLQDDDDFVFPLKADTKYMVMGNLRITANSAGGFKAAFSLPGGASGKFSITDSGSLDAANNVSATAGGGVTAIGTSNNVTVIFGYIKTSSTAGNAVFRWAQNASNGSPTTIGEPSSMCFLEC